MLLTLRLPPLLLLTFVSGAVLASNNQNQSNQCILDCANSALCSRSPDAITLRKFGRLVDSCQCPTNYGGVACDIPLYTCTTSSDCPGSGNSCQDGLCDNACAAAAVWLRSSFAEQGCRKAITQYCSNSREYCTNGGQCTSGYRGTAAESLTDSTLLCQCPPEFTGRHCERVNLPPTVLLPPPVFASLVSSSSSSGTSGNRATIVLVLGALVGAVSLILIAFSYIQKRRQVQGHRRRYSESGEDERINAHDLLLHIPTDEIDEELAAAIVASASTARPSARSNSNAPNRLV
jgi:hypothetical protein